MDGRTHLRVKRMTPFPAQARVTPPQLGRFPICQTKWFPMLRKVNKKSFCFVSPSQMSATRRSVVPCSVAGIFWASLPSHGFRCFLQECMYHHLQNSEQTASLVMAGVGIEQQLIPRFGSNS